MLILVGHAFGKDCLYLSFHGTQDDLLFHYVYVLVYSGNKGAALMWTKSDLSHSLLVKHKGRIILKACNVPNAHVKLLVNTAPKHLITTLIRTNKPNCWGATTIPKEKALCRAFKLT